MVTVYTHGNDRLPLGNAMRNTPHIQITTFDGNAWHVASVTPIARH